ncbi:MAG: hypothetical protein EOO41_04275, partial [Methanobacteriota archaeon]
MPLADIAAAGDAAACSVWADLPRVYPDFLTRPVPWMRLLMEPPGVTESALHALDDVPPVAAVATVTTEAVAAGEVRDLDEEEESERAILAMLAADFAEDEMNSAAVMSAAPDNASMNELADDADMGFSFLQRDSYAMSHVEPQGAMLSSMDDRSRGSWSSSASSSSLESYAHAIDAVVVSPPAQAAQGAQSQPRRPSSSDEDAFDSGPSSMRFMMQGGGGRRGWESDSESSLDESSHPVAQSGPPTSFALSRQSSERQPSGRAAPGSAAPGSAAPSSAAPGSAAPSSAAPSGSPPLAGHYTLVSTSTSDEAAALEYAAQTELQQARRAALREFAQNATGRALLRDVQAALEERGRLLDAEDLAYEIASRVPVVPLAQFESADAPTSALATEASRTDERSPPPPTFASSSESSSVHDAPAAAARREPAAAP